MSMDKEAQLKLQAYLDNELSESESREVANWLARDREAVALHQELRNTRQALVGQEIGIELPESREFFWSKIQREIDRTEVAQPRPASRPWMAAVRRLLVPASAVTVLVAIILLGVFGSSHVPASEMAVADPGAFTYHDFKSGTTLVWFSYPAENEVADNE